MLLRVWPFLPMSSTVATRAFTSSKIEKITYADTLTLTANRNPISGSATHGHQLKPLTANFDLYSL